MPANCEMTCADALAMFPGCDDEYYVAIQCATAQPLSSWTCDPNNGITFTGPGCDAEVNAFVMCVNP